MHFEVCLFNSLLRIKNGKKKKEKKYSTFRAKTTKSADCISSILLILICSIAHKILVAMVTTFENTSQATAKLVIF